MKSLSILKKFPLFLLVALANIAFSTVDIITPQNDFSETENRRLTTMPAVSAKGLIDGSFALKYEEYISDQFLLRDFWVSTKSIAEFALMKLENNNIVFGKDGYLFNKFFSFNDKYLKNNLMSIDKFAAEMKAPVFTMIVPSKYYPLIEYVPDGLPLVEQSYYINSIDEFLSKNCTPVNVKDILSVNHTSYIYYKTDHHWTNFGAYLAYNQFALSAGFVPFEYTDYQPKTVSDFLGTHFQRSNPVVKHFDNIEYYNFDIGSLTIKGFSESDKVYPSLYNFDQFLKKDKYAAFLYGNNGYTIIKSKPSSIKLDSVLVIKDSFGNSFIPMLTENYNNIHVIDTRYFPITESFKQFANMDFDNILILYSFESLVSDTTIAKLSNFD